MNVVLLNTSWNKTPFVAKHSYVAFVTATTIQLQLSNKFKNILYIISVVLSYEWMSSVILKILMHHFHLTQSHKVNSYCKLLKLWNCLGGKGTALIVWRFLWMLKTTILVWPKHPEGVAPVFCMKKAKPLVSLSTNEVLHLINTLLCLLHLCICSFIKREVLKYFSVQFPVQ